MDIITIQHLNRSIYNNMILQVRNVSIFKLHWKTSGDNSSKTPVGTLKTNKSFQKHAVATDEELNGN